MGKKLIFDEKFDFAICSDNTQFPIRYPKVRKLNKYIKILQEQLQRMWNWKIDFLEKRFTLFEFSEICKIEYIPKENEGTFLFYFKFSGFRHSNSGTTKRPSFRISTSSKKISPPPYSGVWMQTRSQ